MFLSCAFIFISSLPVFAFGNIQYSDLPYFATYDSNNSFVELDGHGMWVNGQWRTSSDVVDDWILETPGFPGYHLCFYDDDGNITAEKLERIHSVTSYDQYVGGALIGIPIINRVYYVVKQTVPLNFDRSKTYTSGLTEKWVFTISRQRANNNNGWSGNADRHKSSSSNDYLYPVRFWFLGYYYILYDTGMAMTPSTYNVQNATELSEEEKDKISEELQDAGIGDGVQTDLDAQDFDDTPEETTEEYTGTTEYQTYSTIIDSSAEYSKLSEFNSKLDEQDSNISGLNDKISSNLDEVSSNLGDVKSLYEGTLGWLPSWLIALIVCGAIMIIAVKVMGR